MQKAWGKDVDIIPKKKEKDNVLVGVLLNFQ